MPAIMAAVARLMSLLRDMLENILSIYAEKGMAPFKRPLVIALVVPFVLYNFLYRPLQSRIVLKSAELEKWRIIDAHYSDYQHAGSSMDAYRTRLPNLKDKEEWLKAVLTTTAKNYGIAPDSLSAQHETEVGNFLLVSLEASVTTTYAKFGKWLADMEKTPKLLRVSEVTIAKAGRPGFIKVTLKLSTIYPKYGGAGGQSGV